MKITRFISIIFLVCLWLLSFNQKAYAYIDPGSGSYILQVIIGLLLGAVFTMKIYWAKVKQFLVNLFRRKEKK